MAIIIRRGGHVEVALSSVGKPFQARVYKWLIDAFGEIIARNKRRRALRFIEEAVELVQALGLGENDVSAVARSVYCRPPHKPEREVGGVMTSLGGLCEAHGFDMAAIGEATLRDNYRRIHEIREKERRKAL